MLREQMQGSALERRRDREHMNLYPIVANM